MNLPRDLWPGVGGWQGPPSGEQGAPLEVAPGDELFPEQDEKENDRAKEKADSDQRGWFARWRERREQSKLRAGEMKRRLDDARLRDEQWAGRHQC